MTNDILSPADPQIVELFKHGKCLTLDFSRDVKNVSVTMQKTQGVADAWFVQPPRWP